MDATLLESLLYQRESEILDFKRDQYPFDHETEDRKSELLKDILAFANAWRQSDAYILIGIQEVPNGRAAPYGIKDHLASNRLQEFVNGKTQRPVTFSYTPVTFEGVQVGVLTIPLQERPIFLNKSFGRLQANTVYIRRGDTTAIADPDEVARMGASVVRAAAEPVLHCQFANIADRDALGLHLTLQCEVKSVPERSAIPVYGELSGPHRRFNSSVDDFRNRDYYRDIADWLRDFSHLLPFGITVANPSPVLAQDVVLTLQLSAGGSLAVVDESKMPPFPRPRIWPSVPQASARRECRVDVSRYGDRFEIRARLGDIHPGMSAWTEEVFYIGARESLTVPVQVTVSASTLRAPAVSNASISIAAAVRQIDVRGIAAAGKGRC